VEKPTNNKVIVTAALTGAIHTPTMSPYLPITPKQLVDEIIAVSQAGGSVVHLHVRDPGNGYPVSDQEAFREIASEVKKQCDIVICPTTGGPVGEPVAKRAKVVSNLQPEMASLNAGSINFAIFQSAKKFSQWKFEWEKKYLEDTEDNIFANTFKTLREYLNIFHVAETKPEFEIYDVGMINNLAHLIDFGYVRRPIYIQFVMGILGGIPAKPENLVFLLETARKAIGDFEFSVCAAGRFQMSLCTLSLIMGGNARVGLEDNLYLEKNVLAKSNAEQVEKIIRIARELGFEPATPREAREILNLKGLDKVNF
jgi:uncharacterized protein (DUF849 family)